MCEYQYMDELHARPRHRQAHISACAYMTIWVVFLHVQLRRADLHARVQPQARVPVNHEGTYASSTWGMIARANYAILAIAQLAEHLTVDICSNQMVPGSIPGRQMPCSDTPGPGPRPRSELMVRGFADTVSQLWAQCPHITHAGVGPCGNMSPPGVEPGLSRPQRDVLATRR